MVGWHQRLNGHEFEQTLGGGEGQESLTGAAVREVTRSSFGLRGRTITELMSREEPPTGL